MAIPLLAPKHASSALSCFTYSPKSMNFRKLSSLPARETDRNSSPAQRGAEQLPARGHPQQEWIKPSSKQEHARKGVLTRTQNHCGKRCWGCRAEGLGASTALQECCSSLENLYQKCWYWKFTCASACQRNLPNHMPKDHMNIVIWGIMNNILRKESQGQGGEVIKGQWWKNNLRFDLQKRIWKTH